MEGWPRIELDFNGFFYRPTGVAYHLPQGPIRVSAKKTILFLGILSNQLKSILITLCVLCCLLLIRVSFVFLSTEETLPCDGLNSAYHVAIVGIIWEKKQRWRNGLNGIYIQYIGRADMVASVYTWFSGYTTCQGHLQAAANVETSSNHLLFSHIYFIDRISQHSGMLSVAFELI